MESIDWLLGRQGPLIPPRRLRVRVGGANDFKKVGEKILNHLVDSGGSLLAFQIFIFNSLTFTTRIIIQMEHSEQMNLHSHLKMNPSILFF